MPVIPPNAPSATRARARPPNSARQKGGLEACPPRASSHDDDADSVDDLSPQSSTRLKPSKQILKKGQRERKPVSTASAPADLAAVSSPAVRGNVSHTRRCRAKVNNNFDRLLDVLPAPSEGTEVKHKAQILAYAIDTFRVVRCHNMHLEMQLALSSPYQMHRWVDSVARKADTLTEALKPFMALICITKKWKYAELWAPCPGNGGENTTLKFITGALPPNLESEERARLRCYRSFSRKYSFQPRSGVPGRVFLTMRPEWLPLLTDPIAFPRSPHAVRNNVQVTFAVPVIANGSVQMVVEFYDTERRDYDASTLNIANTMAELFGKAFTGPSVIL